MKSLFKPKNKMWVAEREQLVERILEIVRNKPKGSPSGYVGNNIYYLLEDYGVYSNPTKALKSKAIFRITAPVYYIVGTILFIILRPITYVFNINLFNTKVGYFMREWEARL